MPGPGGEATGEVGTHLAAPDADVRAAIDALRVLVREAAPDLADSIKWNAPGVAPRGRHRLAPGAGRRGGVRAVLHRGAGPRAADGFAFADPAGLAQWPAADRGVFLFGDAGEVAGPADALRDPFARRIAATG